jgi:hypothetical protein
VSRVAATSDGHQQCRSRNHCPIDITDGAGSMLGSIDMRLLHDAAPNQTKTSAQYLVLTQRHTTGVLLQDLSM